MLRSKETRKFLSKSLLLTRLIPNYTLYILKSIVSLLPLSIEIIFAHINLSREITKTREIAEC